MQQDWQLLNQKLPTQVMEWQKILLENRGLKNKKDQDDFFASCDPLAITYQEVKLSTTQLQKASERLWQAIKNKEKVIIFGDYDVDGNSATAVLWRTLNFLGLQTLPFIPHRQEHGYGMNERSLTALLPSGAPVPDLVVSVDNGIVAHEAIAKLMQAGSDVVITDHHQPEVDTQGKEKLPHCVAVVHSVDLCGAGVVWFLAKYLLNDKKNRSLSLTSQEINQFLTSLLDLVALATVVDQVPLLGVNRHLVKAGLQVLRKNPQVGLCELIKAADLKPAILSETDLGFGLGPRINAIGRLKNTLDGVRLLCTNNPTKAHHLACHLQDVNKERQELTSDLIAIAQAQVDPENLGEIIIVKSKEFHEGIIGLIASGLVDKYNRPALVFADNAGVMKGSARSIPGVSIIDLLREARTYLLEVGGHTMAAGCSIVEDNYSLFVQELTQAAKRIIVKQDLIPRLTLDNQVNIALLTEPVSYDLIAQFAPYGVGNEKVTVALTGTISDLRTIGNTSQHLKLMIADDSSSKLITALVWRYRERGFNPQVGDQVQIAARVDLDNFRDKRGLQLIVVDLRIPQPLVL